MILMRTMLVKVYFLPSNEIIPTKQSIEAEDPVPAPPIEEGVGNFNDDDHPTMVMTSNGFLTSLMNLMKMAMNQ
jgi:hypothetical protein